MSTRPKRTPKSKPGKAEQAAIDAAVNRLSARTKAPQVSMEAEQAGRRIKTTLAAPHADHDGWRTRLLDAFGTTSLAFADMEVNRLLNAMIPEGGAPSEAELNAAVAVVHGTGPRDEIEAMLASQMAVTHALAMDLLGRTRQSPTVPYMQVCANLATKLQRTFVQQVETLAKLRRGGEQKVRVEHVHVHAGGQAIVGNVAHPGGGGALENRSQPHEPIA